MNLNYNIILCGFMGAGKSTIGKSLSLKTGLEFIDTDNYIENLLDMPIKNIFNKFGEQYFRNIEAEICKYLCLFQNKIISTGGGTLLNFNNVQALHKTSKIIFLNVPLNIIKKRLLNDYSRPLLNKVKHLEKLYYERLPLYKNIADIIVNNTSNIEKTCNEIIKCI